MKVNAPENWLNSHDDDVVAHAHCARALYSVSTEAALEELTYIYFGPDIVTEGDWNRWMNSYVSQRDNASHPGR